MSRTSPSNATMRPSRRLRPPSGAFYRKRWWMTDMCLPWFMTTRYARSGTLSVMTESGFVGKVP
jgi:hypothetical protein